MLSAHRFFHPASADARPLVAISSCLTGQRVRYDGDHKQLLQWEQVLASQLQWLPICPEVGAGLGVPRPPVRLVAVAGQPARVRGRDDPGLDVTDALRDVAESSVAELQHRRVCGYLWQSRSPSCGRDSTPLFDAQGRQIGFTSGIQADHIRRELPWLATAEDTDVATTAGAWRFVLRCRLVYDILQTDSAALPALHRHYAALTDGTAPLDGALGVREKTLLEAAARAGDTTGYLTVFNAAVEGLPADRLLALFGR